MPSLQEARHRHASHYKDVAAIAHDLYLEGGEVLTSGLVMFDQEWDNIRVGQAWAVERVATDDRAARLCVEYCFASIHWLSLRIHPRERMHWLEAAVSAAREIGDPAEGSALGNLGNVYAAIGEPRRAIECYQQALTIAREIGDRRGEGNALDSLGLAYGTLGETHRAIEFFHQHLAVAREIGDRRGESNALGGLGWANHRLGEVRRAIEFHQQALAIAREIGDRRSELVGLGNLGNAHLALGEPCDAIEFYQQDLAIAREIGDRRGEGNHSWNLGLLYEQTDPARAVVLMSVLVEYASARSAIGTRRRMPSAWPGSSEARRRRGRRGRHCFAGGAGVTVLA